MITGKLYLCCKAKGRRLVNTGIIALLLAALASCSWDPKERANPLDPLNPETGADPISLTACLVDYTMDTAVVKKVRLDWSDIQHSALDEYHLYRRPMSDIEDPLTLLGYLAPGSSSYLDTEADAHIRYYYQIWIILANGTDSIPSARVLSPRWL